MKIEPLNSGDLRIWMTDDELCRWGLRLDDMKAGKPETSRTIRRLLGIARQRQAFSGNGSVLVEALPLDGGCLFLFSSPDRFASIAALPQVYTLDSAEAVLQFGERLSAKGQEYLPPASLYRQGEGYVLILYRGLGTAGGCRRLLQEFGRCTGEGYVAAAYVEEHSQPITVGNALQRLCAAYGSLPPTL
ncbi:MAG: adaptor protein MecA [Clostridia bacterium]|nr:adaptor protein MecA [Clostridia bacterium]